jgi:hypothetical protein
MVDYYKKYLKYKAKYLELQKQLGGLDKQCEIGNIKGDTVMSCITKDKYDGKCVIKDNTCVYDKDW